jgi:methyl coenzyme M reductase alpha subunit
VDLPDNGFAGIANEDVEAAEAAYCCVDSVGDALALANVEFHVVWPRAKITDDDLRSLLPEALRDSCSDS